MAVALDILLQVAKGVEALHGQDPPIYHRDLKASNVLMRSRNRSQSQSQSQSQSHSQSQRADYDCFITDFGVSTSAASLTCSE